MGAGALAERGPSRASAPLPGGEIGDEEFQTDARVAGPGRRPFRVPVQSHLRLAAWGPVLGRQ